jgi:3'-phosphoadenosine 5'-phosphosulfate sulfotransferase (PAPS reductase)/FAD synthetase
VHQLASAVRPLPLSPLPLLFEEEPTSAADLARYHWIVLNSSAGKDSQAMLDFVVEQCDRAKFPRDRVVVVHADLGRVEWPGTRALAEEQARHYGLAFHVVRRRQGDLLDHIAQRGMFPSPQARYCTSDHKRGPVYTVFTSHTQQSLNAGKRTPVRILNCMGMRAQESPARARRPPFAYDERASNGKRHVDIWLPLHAWTVEQVWARIKASGVRHHPAYDLGMPRLSCCFCIFSPRSALLLAGKHNPELLAQYVAVENAIGHSFRQELPLASIQQALANGEEPGPVRDWTM